MPASSRRSALLALAAGAALALAPAGTQAASAVHGLTLARANCAACHAIGSESTSPLPTAPRFADLQRTYPDKTMEEILAEGIMVHPSPMPWFAPPQADLDDLLAYLKGLQPRTPAP